MKKVAKNFLTVQIQMVIRKEMIWPYDCQHAWVHMIKHLFSKRKKKIHGNIIFWVASNLNSPSFSPLAFSSHLWSFLPFFPFPHHLIHCQFRPGEELQVLTVQPGTSSCFLALRNTCNSAVFLLLCWLHFHSGFYRILLLSHFSCVRLCATP